MLKFLNEWKAIYIQKEIEQICIDLYTFFPKRNTVTSQQRQNQETKK